VQAETEVFQNRTVFSQTVTNKAKKKTATTNMTDKIGLRIKKMK
jgi:hypothetical protein